MTDEKPWKDSLWMDCLFELLAKAKREGKPVVRFKDVDKLVVEKSHGIVEYKEPGAEGKLR